jgi:hypothetical protein
MVVAALLVLSWWTCSHLAACPGCAAIRLPVKVLLTAGDRLVVMLRDGSPAIS